jgi:D-alanyl-D-alanine carboxypeptidase
MMRFCRALLIVALLVSCSPTDESTPSALKTIDPQAFQDVVQRAATKLKVPGAMVLVRTPKGDVTAGVGTTELGTRTPPTVATHFRIASNTKTMTAALIVLLAQDGKLKLSDPVSLYVPDVPNGENITVAQLLKMRSGLYGYTFDPALAAAMDATPEKAWTPKEALAIAFRHPPLFAPDASYDYSNTNYALLGVVAEKVGGRPLAQQLQERLFGPVGLTQTSLPAAADTSMPAPYSHGYMYGGSIYALADVAYPADVQAGAEAPAEPAERGVRDARHRREDHGRPHLERADVERGELARARDGRRTVGRLVAGGHRTSVAHGSGWNQPLR